MFWERLLLFIILFNRHSYIYFPPFTPKLALAPCILKKTKIINQILYIRVLLQSHSKPLSSRVFADNMSSERDNSKSVLYFDK